jgi:hypothetical protein
MFPRMVTVVVPDLTICSQSFDCLAVSRCQLVSVSVSVGDTGYYVRHGFSDVVCCLKGVLVGVWGHGNFMDFSALSLFALNCVDRAGSVSIVADGVCVP